MVRKKRGKALVSKKSKTKMLAGQEVHKLAHYAFFAGILVAILAGLLKNVLNLPIEWLMATLVFLGAIVGLFNLTAKETGPFLTAAIALMLAGIVNLGLIPYIGELLRNILSNIVVFVVPGAIIVGMKTIWQLASE